MDRIKIDKPSIIESTNSFIVDSIKLYKIDEVNTVYYFYFLAFQNSTEEGILLVSKYVFDKEKDKSILMIINDFISSNLSDKLLLERYYFEDSEFEELKKKPYFKTTAYTESMYTLRGSKGDSLEVLFSRDSYIKFILSIKSLYSLQYDIDHMLRNYMIYGLNYIFESTKYNKIKFCNITRIKYEGTSNEYINGDLIWSKYICGDGPDEYRISVPSEFDMTRKLRYGLNKLVYMQSIEEFKPCKDYFILGDCVYLYYYNESKNQFTILRFHEDTYNKLSFVNKNFIYEKEI